jgi:hypothetical protein
VSCVLLSGGRDFQASCRSFWWVLNCYSAVSVEGSGGLSLPEFLLCGCRQTLWRLSIGPVAATPCQSSLVGAIGVFWRIWGCRRGRFGAASDFWRFCGGCRQVLCILGAFPAICGGFRRICAGLECFRRSVVLSARLAVGDLGLLVDSVVAVGDLGLSEGSGVAVGDLGCRQVLGWLLEFFFGC